MCWQGGMSASLALAHVVFGQKIIECWAAYTKRERSLGNIVVGIFQRPDDGVAFGFITGMFDGDWRQGFVGRQAQVTGLDDDAVGGQYGLLDNVAQFGDVAMPRVAADGY